MEDLTPQRFLSECVGFKPDAYVSLVHDPRHPFYTPYTVSRLGNVVGGRMVLYINVPIETLKRAVMATIDGGKPVWVRACLRRRVSVDAASDATPI